jgi:hypothetical protein
MNFKLEWNCLERIRGQLPTCDSDIGGSAPVHRSKSNLGWCARLLVQGMNSRQ